LCLDAFDERADARVAIGEAKGTLELCNQTRQPVAYVAVADDCWPAGIRERPQVRGSDLESYMRRLGTSRDTGRRAQRVEMSRWNEKNPVAVRDDAAAGFQPHHGRASQKH
jgi:hypothetical protein